MINDVGPAETGVRRGEECADPGAIGQIDVDAVTTAYLANMFERIVTSR